MGHTPTKMDDSEAVRGVQAIAARDEKAERGGRGEAPRDAESRGWPTARLVEVCEKITDGTHRSPPNGAHGVPYVTAKNIRRFAIDLTDLTYISEEHHREIYSRCDPRLGDVLYIKDGATMGIAAVNTLDYEFSLLSSVALIRPRADSLRGDFLTFWLNHPDTYRGVRGTQTGCAIQRMVLDQIRNMEIPVPPLAEQERIAGRLTEQLAAVERARGAAQSRLAAAESLPAAYLREVFEEPEASGWETVDHACLTIDYGHTASAKATASGPRFLRITDIQDSRVDWATVPGCDIDADDETSLGLADGDIVFARTGATTGKSFLIRNPPRAVFASYLIRLRADPTVALPDFVYLFFRSDAYWEQLRGFARGAAQPNVNATLLGQIELPLPPLSDQRRIAADLAARLAGAERLAEGIRAELAAIEALPAALLREAFGGTTNEGN